MTTTTYLLWLALAGYGYGGSGVHTGGYGYSGGFPLPWGAGDVTKIIRAPDRFDPARDANWVARCKPTIKADRYGVSRYSYAAKGCEWGYGLQD